MLLNYQKVIQDKRRSILIEIYLYICITIYIIINKKQKIGTEIINIH